MELCIEKAMGFEVHIMSGLPKGGYGIIGRAAMRSDKVCKEAKAVYALLCSYTGSKHYCYPTVKTLAKDLMTSERTIIRLTEELKANGFCKKVKVSDNNRKTAYVPLSPYGSIGDTDDTYQSKIGDTDDTINGDTDDTLRITSKSNSKKAKNPAEDGQDFQRFINHYLKIIQDKTGMVLYQDFKLRAVLKRVIKTEKPEYIENVLHGYLNNDFMKKERAWNFTGFFSSKEKMEKHKSRSTLTTKCTLPDFSHIQYDDAPFDEHAMDEFKVTHA